MPIYEYRCLACGEELEALQKLSDEPLRECPNCGQAELKKKVSAAAFRLKGGGWYETDFKTGEKKNLAAGSDSAAGDSGKPAETNTGDAKPKTSDGEKKTAKKESSSSKSTEGKKTA